VVAAVASCEELKLKATVKAGSGASEESVVKPKEGVCARVAIGQVLLSVRCKDQNGVHAQEALRRAKFKFPGRQKIIVSRKWGFTKFARVDYVK
jgi:ribosomal protein L16/L10AE